MASFDELPRINGRDIDLVIKARMRAIGAVNRSAHALAVIDSALIARANAMASVLAGIDSALIARANVMAPTLAGIDSALTARAYAMAPALAAMSARANALAPALAAIDSAMRAQVKAIVPSFANIQIQSPAPLLSIRAPLPSAPSVYRDHDCCAEENCPLRRRVRLLESQIRRGNWIDSDEYDVELDSMPWSDDVGGTADNTPSE